MKYLIAFTLLIATLSLHGQNIERRGFVIGLGIGGGIIDIQDSGAESTLDKTTGALSLPNLQMGFMLSERTALLVSIPGAIYEHDGRDRSFEAFIPSLQHWVGDNWWVRGGVGLAMDMPALYDLKDLDDPEFNIGYAMAASTGVELVQRGSFALDLQGRIQYGRAYLDNDAHRDGLIMTVGLGFTWY
jgi:hypothetical protein